MDKAPASSLMREAQTIITKSLPNTGMAVLLDFGDELFIHLAKKQQVGEWLVYQVLMKTYGMDYNDYQSPIYGSMKVEGINWWLLFSQQSP